MRTKDEKKKSPDNPKPKLGRILLYPVAWGFIRALWYLILGIFGNARWRMPPEGHLSEQGRKAFKSLPDAVQYAVIRPLGNKAEFGRRELIRRLPSSDDRRWALNVLARPYDVLAIVSAIVLSLALYLFAPLYIDPGLLETLPSINTRAEALVNDLGPVVRGDEVRKLQEYFVGHPEAAFSPHVVSQINTLESTAVLLREMTDMRQYEKIWGSSWTKSPVCHDNYTCLAYLQRWAKWVTAFNSE